MKNLKLIILCAITGALFASCNGDHSTRSGVDTTSNTSVGNYDVRTNIDTSKTTTVTGDATLLDNTASGGVMVAKDTTHMKVRSVSVAAATTPVAAAATVDTAAKK